MQRQVLASITPNKKAPASQSRTACKKWDGRAADMGQTKERRGTGCCRRPRGGRRFPQGRDRQSPARQLCRWAGKLPKPRRSQKRSHIQRAALCLDRVEAPPAQAGRKDADRPFPCKNRCARGLRSGARPPQMKPKPAAPVKRRSRGRRKKQPGRRHAESCPKTLSRSTPPQTTGPQNFRSCCGERRNKNSSAAIAR